MALKRNEQLWAMLEPAVTAVGMSLWGIEFQSGGPAAILRIYIDSPNGVTIDDCERVSHQVSGVLDVEDPIKSEYNLEVSSPGLDRPMFSFEQFGEYVGEQFRFKLQSVVAGKRNFTAVLQGFDGQSLLLAVDGQVITVPFSSIDKANLVPKFD